MKNFKMFTKMIFSKSRSDLPSPFFFLRYNISLYNPRYLRVSFWTAWHSKTKWILEADGKPSTWFPLGALVELLPPEESRHWILHIIIYLFHVWSKSNFQTFKNMFQTYKCLDTMNEYYLMRRISYFCAESILKFSIC